ncbi:MAG: FAD:protein FMN transferase [Breznakibacter sp.]
MKYSLLLAMIGLLFGCASPEAYFRNEGFVFGTTYHFIYECNSDLQVQIMDKIASVDWSLLTFKDSSVISRVNKNDTSVVLDDHFVTVYNKALEVTLKTNGAFDMTVAPLVNAWGFGFTNRDSMTQAKVDSMLEFVGMGNVKLERGKIIKADPRLMLDASAIAKGYGVDVAALFLESVGVKNYMVEIGGELRVKGHNDKGLPWSVGIDKPIDDPAAGSRELQEILRLDNQSLATSGNYRNFYYQGNKKYAHTIDPKTGYPVQTNVLSSSVIAPDCMTADAYATAFMVLGLEKSLAIANTDPTIEAYFIYSDENGNMQEVWSTGFERLIKK